MDYAFFKMAYELGECTQEELQEAVQRGFITQEQYNDIISNSTN